MKSLRKFIIMICLMMPLVFVNQSCKDLLKEDVITQIGNDYLTTPKGFNDAVNAAYSTLRAYYGTQQGLTMTEYGTDIYATGADGGYKGFHFYDTQLNPTVDWLQSVWDELYRGINTCNTVIESAKTITGVSDAVKNQRVAECRYLRGLYYFLLYMQWGGVDLRLSPTLVPTKQTTRASDKAMFDAIIADLEAAYPALEAKKASSDYGRATKPACGHLLGYVYLTRNNVASAKGADDVNKAVTYLSDVVSNTAYGFSLLPDFASVFDEGNQINNEVVWSVQYTTDPTTNTPVVDLNGNTGGNNLHLFFGAQYDVQAGMQRDVFYGRPFKRLRPTQYLIQTVFKDKTNDSRFKKSFRDTWLCNKPGTYSAFALDNSKTGSITWKTGDTTMLIVETEMPKEERAKRNYQVITPGFASGTWFNEAVFFTLTKFFDTKRPDLTYTHGSRDYFVFRLADTKLLLAEAYLLAGKRTEALAQVNDVRRRAAFNAAAQANMTITDAQLNMDFIMEERARELAGEQIRWLDLKRWGKLVERVKLYNAQAAANIKDIHYVRPIPQAQIDRTEGGTFGQNPGY